MNRSRLLGPALAPAALLLTGWFAAAAPEPPQVRELRTQQVDDALFFHVRFDAPADLAGAPLNDWRNTDVRHLTRLPQLTPQDGARAVFLRLDPLNPFRVEDQATPPIRGLEFLGKVDGKDRAKFLLLWPTKQEVDEPLIGETDADGKPKTRKVGRTVWAEAAVELDFTRAEKVAVPEAIRKRKKLGLQPDRSRVQADDLEGLWALAQAERFAVLEAQTPEFSFYGFGREACARKYGVRVPQRMGRAFGAGGNFYPQQLYDLTTGAEAVTESLQMQRMIGRDFKDGGERSVDVTRITGIEIGEHPWKKMMGDRKPTLEPLARMVPHDNYYFRCKNPAKLIELAELLDQWGGNLLRSVEIQGRDYQVRQRYERQLCLKTALLGVKTERPVLRGLAVTGSDGYLQTGSDLTLLFDCENKALLLGALDQFIGAAKKEWGAALRERKITYREVEVESFVTPLREVSLHRAIVDDVVIYSNSAAGVRRVLDAAQGRSKCLADSLDFQYMRTVFTADDDKEDCFVFLSDPFIRQMVGPASKIKEKRRLEALTSLRMKTNEVMFTAWETGRLPEDEKLLFASAVLKAEEVYVPGGKPLYWDAERQTAVSEEFNTLHFATPLIETPIDRVTPTEERDYNQFRQQYLGLWRQYFDPVGVRIALKDGQVRAEAYILPLVANTQYNDVRRVAGDGVTSIDVRGYSPKTLAQFVTHLSPHLQERNFLRQQLSFLGVPSQADWLGEWALIRFDDSPLYGELARMQWRHEFDPEAPAWDQNDWRRQAELALQLPVTVGVDVKSPLMFAAVMTALRAMVMNAAPGWVTWERLPEAYKDVAIVRIQSTLDGPIATELNRDRKERFQPAVYYANVDGAFFASLRLEPIKDLIDQAALRKEGKLPKPEQLVVNQSLYLSPAALERAKEFVGFALEHQTHRQATANLPVWYALYHTGLVPSDASDELRTATALRFLGYVPISPDATAYAYEPKTDEVLNRRHGSLRRPTFQAKPVETSPVARLLEQLKTVRADLRFKEDGINTVVTIERKKP